MDQFIATYEKAQQGDAAAQYEIGLFLDIGQWAYSEDEDFKPEARIWMRKSADQGHPLAQFWMGDIANCDGNVYEAISWYELAAHQGNVEAMTRLGFIYLPERQMQYGHKNAAKAFKWFKLAADAGDIFSVSKLIDLYYNGKGVRKNIEEALTCLLICYALRDVEDFCGDWIADRLNKEDEKHHSKPIWRNAEEKANSWLTSHGHEAAY